MKWYSNYVDKKGDLDVNYLKKNFPKEVAVELTNICSHRCIHCPKSLPIEQQARPYGKMNLETLKKIIDEAVLLKCDKIAFCQDGDALLAPDILIEGVKYIVSKDKSMKIDVVTNAFNLTPEISEKLLDIKANYSFIFDLYAASEPLFERITQTKHFHRCRKHIEDFMKLLKKRGLSYTVYLQALDYISKKEQKRLFKFGKSVGISNINLHKLCAYPGMDLGFLGLKKIPKNTKRFPCNQPFHAMNVLYNGDVTVCCLNYGHIVVGNVKEQKMEDIWTGKKWNEIRTKHLKNDLSELICSKCDVWYYQDCRFFKNKFSKSFYKLKQIPKKINHKIRNWRLKSDIF